MHRSDGSAALRVARLPGATMAALCLALAGGGAGCADTAGDCEARGDCVVGAAGARGSSGAGGSAEAACTPSELGVGEAPADDCGAFVSFSLGDDAVAAGTKAAPYATVGKALAAGARRIYLCGERFDEVLDLPAGTTLFGALDCADGWTYQPTVRTAFEPSAARLDAAARPAVVQVTGNGASASIFDVDVTAPDANDPSESAIAVLVDAATVRIERGRLAAGRGAVGAPGATELAAALDGTNGNDGTDACLVAAPTPAAAAVSMQCADGTSTGGASGMGGISSGYNGVAGLPAGSLGQRGLGQTAVSGEPWSCEAGGSGQDGSPGDAGAAGPGATGSGSLGPLGFSGAAGSSGEAGTRGQGGGGGGGTRNEWAGGYACGNATEGGASGGSGGAGGCGGDGGGGGQSGGASIALVSLAAAVTLVDCELEAASGGQGGVGGDGQPGGSGGPGGVGGGSAGTAAAAGCGGGAGGSGGAGGPGGGGRGGPSFGIAFTGALPTYAADTLLVVSDGGEGGLGGDANTAENAGLAGESAPTRSFD